MEITIKGRKIIYLVSCVGLTSTESSLSTSLRMSLLFGRFAVSSDEEDVFISSSVVTGGGLLCNAFSNMTKWLK